VLFFTIGTAIDYGWLMKNSIKINTSGLCVNCKHADSCTLHTTAEIVNHCEEYEFEENLKSLSIATEVEEILSVADEDEVIHTGLCVSCDFRSNCALKEKHTITLNCESYQ
jgi:hypothetical protein